MSGSPPRFCRVCFADIVEIMSFHPRGGTFRRNQDRLSIYIRLVGGGSSRASAVFLPIYVFPAFRPRGCTLTSSRVGEFPPLSLLCQNYHPRFPTRPRSVRHPFLLSHLFVIENPNVNPKRNETKRNETKRNETKRNDNQPSWHPSRPSSPKTSSRTRRSGNSS